VDGGSPTGDDWDGLTRSSGVVRGCSEASACSLALRSFVFWGAIRSCLCVQGGERRL